MDAAAQALSVRSELRSYALRRCIRFYAATLVFTVAWAGGFLAASEMRAQEILRGGAAVLCGLAVVELASMLVIAQMARRRDQLEAGPETGLWAFAQGPWPSLVAAAAFVAAAGILWTAQPQFGVIV